MTGLKPMLSNEDVNKVAPALEAYTKTRLLAEVWKRPGLARAIAASSLSRL
jgi:4-carboxymuconolactone decarboxylase